MALNTPKSVSVTESGEPDGWEIPAGYSREMDPSGTTRLVVSVPTNHLAAVHAALVSTLQPPLGFLYRQVVDRENPRPSGAPPRDFVALELPVERVVTALSDFTDLVYHDARCEIWVRGQLGEQVVLDADGLIYAYPDDPMFVDVCVANGLSDGLEGTIVDQDYARHQFHAICDGLEAKLRASLALTEVPSQFR